MATYVNDLRLKEISTGDESGTWGTSTNTNLELIGEALGYATQQVFSSDADATTTIADGASDPARAMYFKITSAGSLTATRTCTIAPNTVSRVMFIENATSGSQSIAISQGSGANVTILTGKTAVVYLDGAGATAAVVDAMSGVDPGVTDTLTEVLVAGNTSGGTNIELSTTDKVQFRDTGIYINSSADGQLDIVADTEIQIAATTVDLNGNLDVSGTTVSAGKITANAGIDIDNINIDGTTIALSSGDLTLDVAGEIHLDSDSGIIRVRDAGGDFGMFQISSNDFIVRSMFSDADLLFKGNDGGSVITALTLDMSTGGTAYFSDDVRLTDNHALRLGNDGDIVFYHDNSNGYLENGTGNLTLDVAGNIILDADSGEIEFKDGGTTFGNIAKSGNDLRINQSIQDGDIVFRGNDGGGIITALTLDLSEAGAATFNSTIAATSADLRNTSNGAETTALSLRNFAAGANTATALNFYPTQSTTRFASIVAENIDGNNNITLSFLTSSGDTPSAALTLNEDRTATFANGITLTDGNLVVASGHGIDFSATAGSGTSELLDDYEEGTWSPSFSGAGTPSYNSQFGRYTKIGRVVYCTIAIRATSVSGASNIEIAGLPFTPADAGDTSQRSTYSPFLGGHCSGLSESTGRFRTTDTTNMAGVKSSLGTTFMTAAEFSSGGSPEITGDFWYYTN
jgi:hypothetical protein